MGALLFAGLRQGSQWGAGGLAEVPLGSSLVGPPLCLRSPQTRLRVHVEEFDPIYWLISQILNSSPSLGGVPFLPPSFTPVS